MCFACNSEQTENIPLYSISVTVFITQVESVYCAVRTGSLNQIFINEAECLLRGTDWVFNSDFYKRDRECLLRGTDWVFKSDFYK